jgi:hypothetical protein
MRICLQSCINGCPFADCCCRWAVAAASSSWELQAPAAAHAAISDSSSISSRRSWLLLNGDGGGAAAALAAKICWTGYPLFWIPGSLAARCLVQEGAGKAGCSVASDDAPPCWLKTGLSCASGDGGMLYQQACPLS